MVRKEQKELWILPVVKILLFMYFLTALFLVGLTFLLMKMQLTEQSVNLGIIIIYVVVGFVGGFIAGKRMKTKKFFWGMILGITYFFVLVAGSFFFHKGIGMVTEKIITTMILCMASGMIGGMVS